jgi:Family of unknown function (DUF6279)
MDFERAMRVHLRVIRTVIVGVLAFVVAGCSAVRLGYANGPLLVWWWLDGYVDFRSQQVPAVKAAIDRWFEWHRRTQLPGYADMLALLAAKSSTPATAAEVCRVNDLVRALVVPAIDRALVEAGDVIPGLGEPQFRHLRHDPDERRQRSVERAIKRIEQIYGPLDEAQRKVVADGVAASPFDPQAWIEERKARQRDTLATLRRLVATKADRDTRIAALRALVQRSEEPSNPAYRAYQKRLVDYNCAFIARVHNATTAAQRRRAHDTLEGWEEDVRALMTPQAPPSAVGAPG